MVPHCWLLTTPRSGSSYLAECLNKTRGLSDVDKDNNVVHRMLFVEHAHDKNCRNAEDFWGINPVHTKLHSHHHQRLKFELPRDGKYVILDRDAADVATSVYLSTATGVHHIKNDDEREAYCHKSVEIDPGKLGVICGMAMEWSQYWRSMLHGAGIAHLAVDYHKATSDPLGTCEYIFKYFGVSKWDSSQIRNAEYRKMAHPQHGEVRDAALRLMGRTA